MSARFAGVLAAMLALLLAGLTTGTRIYYYLLFILALLVMYALLSVLWTLATVKVGVKGVKSRALRGDSLMALLSVEHKCLFPAGSLRLELSVPGSGGRQELTVNVPPFARRSFRSAVYCAHRGYYDVGVSRIHAADAFGLFSLSRSCRQKPMRLEVCPKVYEMPEMELRATDVGPEFISRAAEDNASPSDTRKWRDGDELKKVHWKLSLRKREIMVRTFEESARPDTLIIPDLSEIAALQDHRLTVEDAVCEASLGAAKAQLEAGYPVRMPLQSRRPQEPSGRSAADLPGFADALMRVEFNSPYPYEQVLTLMMRRMQRTGGAVLVTGRLGSRIADIAMRMQKSGVQVKYIWICEAPRQEDMEMLERMKMAGVLVESVNPWAQEILPGDAAEETILEV